MKISNLVESSYKDVYSGAFNDFLIDYKDIYDNSLYVVFSNDSSLTFKDSNAFDSLPGGLVVFPLSSVVNRPAEYTEYANREYLHVIKADGSIMHVGKIRFKHIDQLGNKMGIGSEEMATLIETYESSFSADPKLFYGYVFNSIIWKRIENGALSKESIDKAEVSHRLRSLGFNAYVDTARKPSQSILSNAYPSIGVMLTKSSYEPLTVYHLQKTKSASEGESYFRDKDIIRELGERIAHSMGTRLNTDPAYNAFLDFHHWTIEGMQIRITAAFGNTKSDVSDGVYYVIEIKTPFGMLVHTSAPSESYDTIAAHVGKIYKTLNVSDGKWVPQNRDIFLTGIRRKERMLDQQMDDIADTATKYYPRLREYARIKGIVVPVVDYFSTYEKLFLNDLMEVFMDRQEPKMYNFLEQLEENGFDFNNFLFKPLPKRITLTLIKKIAMVYDIGKKKYPSRKGWHVFKDL